MIRGPRTITIGSVVLALTLAASSGMAWAHRGPGGRTPGSVKGVVTSVDLSNNKLQVQTQSATVNVTLANSTHVIRDVHGSAADLAVGQHVEATLSAAGGTTIAAIEIQGKGTYPTRTKSTRATPLPTPQPRPTHTYGTNPVHKSPHSAPPEQTHVDGQIMAVKGNTITLSGFRGQSATYSLAVNLTVTKEMVGKFSNLAVGETVQVELSRTGGPAQVIVILSS